MNKIIDNRHATEKRRPQVIKTLEAGIEYPYGPDVVFTILNRHDIEFTVKQLVKIFQKYSSTPELKILGAIQGKSYHVDKKQADYLTMWYAQYPKVLTRKQVEDVKDVCDEVIKARGLDEDPPAKKIFIDEIDEYYDGIIYEETPITTGTIFEAVDRVRTIK